MQPLFAPTLAEMPVPVIILLSILAIAVAVLLIVFVMVPVFKGLGWFIRHIFAFIGGMLYSALRIIGGLITCVVFIPLVLLNIVIGRWSAAAHFGRTMQDEIRTVGQNVYRLCIGHPARLLLLKPLVEGIEQRVPEAVAHAPTSDKPSKRQGQFEGYKIVGSLKGGGSGGRLYIAEPDETKKAIFTRRGQSVDQVVIKTFSLADGSSLPQIVRESKSLEAAKNLGLILEHELNDQRFYYVMRYVPGEMLSIVTHQLHDRAGPAGLDGATMRDALTYTSDLCRTLETYHQGGLWHKDVKPDNIIISSGRAHLVDFGLVTPLRSAMTLTTHGTEYFRDPEMVRLALKGVKVADVNGAKFDVYAVGAVLFSIIERNFPAHGGLSQITKKCPEAVRWIVRRAMAEYDSRYASAGEMLRDVDYVLAQADPTTARPVDLPSMRAGSTFEPVDAEPFVVPPRAARPETPPMGDAGVAGAAAASPIPPRSPEFIPAGMHKAADALHRAADAMASVGLGGAAEQMRQRADEFRAARPRPRIRMHDWWRGGFSMDPRGAAGADPVPPPGARPVDTGERERLRDFAAMGGAARVARAAAGGARRSAREQLEAARARVQARRTSASTRLRGLRGVGVTKRYSNKPNPGVSIAFLVFIGVCVAGAMSQLKPSRDHRSNRTDVVINDFSKDEIRAALSSGIAGLKEGIAEIKDGVRRGAENAKNRSHKRYAAEPKHVEVDGRWVFLDDLADSLDEQLRAVVHASVASLEGAGAELVGSGTEEDDLQTIASLRSAVGASRRTDDAPAIEHIKAWLAEQNGEFEGVIWFAPTDTPGAFSTAVIGAKGVDAGPVGDLVAHPRRAEER